ncbi:related to queuine-tRNA ribosyltransferase [Cephalotrichum gorgonifer]|uniref:Queuine tRNA-ribosyltransferase accessory subunit 2 n=1 Tax=Cephalotrichum gorgonifer TaxID=2041049 RepID=A0AAE8MSN2_9PEZI|nr:related to queuine-tRNA ribosyltransferase [Cephalotrichum gorgonifer]
MVEETGANGPEGMGFQVLKSAVGSGGARLGKLCLPNRLPIQTPAYIAVTSRGTVPHLTADNLVKYTSFESAYLALEDFIEKKVPPFLSTPSPDSPLRAFTAFPKDRITILGPRRVPAVTTPVGNGSKHVALFTSTGFRNVPATDYASYLATLRPDIAIALADLPHTSATPPARKLTRMVDRTGDWLDTLLRNRSEEPRGGDVALFAPVLPIERPIQWQYLDRLSEGASSLSGLAVYDVGLVPDLAANYPALDPLPRLALEAPQSPQQLLRQISLGADLSLVPFVNDTSDAGVALSFSFPAPTSTTESASAPLPLGSDLWSPENKTSLEPLVPGCTCYACTSHHRAYLHHLLCANEMLSWTLLQLHNHHVMTRFFEGVRETLALGTEAFEEAAQAFRRAYESEIPGGTGLRPRARGYHFKSEGGDKKVNEPAWSNFEGEAGGAKTEGAGAGADPVEVKV